MAAAYRYAAGDGLPPHEFLLGLNFRRYGVETVLGRPIGAGEAQRIHLVMAIVGAYQARAASENWAKWAADHPDDNALLNRVMELTECQQP